jgi:hypothetical protein
MIKKKKKCILHLVNANHRYEATKGQAGAACATAELAPG